MGINALLPSLKSIVRTVHVGEAYGGKRVAVDSYCWLHRGAYSCSAELVEGVPTDKFIASFVKRAALLRRCGVEAVYVFDGGRMPGKAAEEADRQRARSTARDRARAHKRAGNSNAANEAYQRAVDVTPEMAKAVIDRLRAEGHACVVAPYEADAQMAYLIRHGFVDGVITEDSDMIPHQCKSVFFKMDADGVGQEIRYNDLALNRDLSFVGFTPDQFLEMCVMSGCDYLPSLPGVGIKRAHGLIRRFRGGAAALRALRFEGVSVPRGYEDGFRDALATFRHQWVFCPRRREMVHLSDSPPPPTKIKEVRIESSEAKADRSAHYPPPMMEADVARLIGARRPPEIVRGVADGALHPMTLQPFEGSTAAAATAAAATTERRVIITPKPTHRGEERTKMEMHSSDEELIFAPASSGSEATLRRCFVPIAGSAAMDNAVNPAPTASSAQSRPMSADGGGDGSDLFRGSDAARHMLTAPTEESAALDLHRTRWITPPPRAKGPARSFYALLRRISSERDELSGEARERCAAEEDVMGCAEAAAAAASTPARGTDEDARGECAVLSPPQHPLSLGEARYALSTESAASVPYRAPYEAVALTQSPYFTAPARMKTDVGPLGRSLDSHKTEKQATVAGATPSKEIPLAKEPTAFEAFALPNRAHVKDNARNMDRGRVVSSGKRRASGASPTPAGKRTAGLFFENFRRG